VVHHSWKESIEEAYNRLTPEYIAFLKDNRGYFPDKYNLFNAFKTLPKDGVKYILFGQEPYPRKESASGYAFIDATVQEIFSDKGLSKEVNRAPSLQNLIKMALVARGDLHPLYTTQEAIAKVPKEGLVSSIDELRVNFEKQGILLLNRALVFTTKEESKQHIDAWQPFMYALLQTLVDEAITVIFFGNQDKVLKRVYPLENFEQERLASPYTKSFIGDVKALKLFKPMDLLAK
jgi:uracil-DNA glycosylase